MKRLCQIITDKEMLPNNTILSITEEEMAEILPNYDRALNDCQNQTDWIMLQLRFIRQNNMSNCLSQIREILFQYLAIISLEN